MYRPATAESLPCAYHRHGRWNRIAFRGDLWYDGQNRRNAGNKGGKNMRYGMIGCGNMGGAIARGLSQSTKDIMVSDRSGKGRALAAELGIVYGDNGTIAAQCDVIFLGVKPHMMQDVLLPLQQILAVRKPLLVTMAAGLTLQTVEAMAGGDLPVIRIMPNTPTAIGKGVIP